MAHKKLIFSVSFILLWALYGAAQTKFFEYYYLKPFISEIRSKAQHKSLKDISSLKEDQLIVTKFPYENWMSENRLIFLQAFFSVKGVSDPKIIAQTIVYHLWMDLQQNALGEEENLLACKPEEWLKCDMKYSKTNSYLFAPMNGLFGVHASDYIERLDSAVSYSYTTRYENIFTNFRMSFNNDKQARGAYNYLKITFPAKDLIHLEMKEKEVFFMQGLNISQSCFERLLKNPFPTC